MLMSAPSRVDGRPRARPDYYHGEQGLIADHPSMLEVRGLTHADYYKDVSFAIREVLGIGGLLDSGKSHLGKGIAGLITPETGTVRLGTNQPSRPDFHDLISKGLAYVPSRRLARGIILPFSVAWSTCHAADGCSQTGWAFGMRRLRSV
jgi:ribose transport system ATP-binding protein